MENQLEPEGTFWENKNVWNVAMYHQNKFKVCISINDKCRAKWRQVNKPFSPKRWTDRQTDTQTSKGRLDHWYLKYLKGFWGEFFWSMIYTTRHDKNRMLMNFNDPWAYRYCNMRPTCPVISANSMFSSLSWLLKMFSIDVHWDTTTAFSLAPPSSALV